jgi:hypothetical protein
MKFRRPLDRTAAILFVIVIASAWIAFGHPAPLSLYGKVTVAVSGIGASVWLLVLLAQSAVGEVAYGFLSYFVYCVVTLHNDRQIRKEMKEAKRCEKQAKEKRS